MSTIKIANETLSIKEYDNQRVVTHHDIDMVHNRPRDTARKAFRRNFKHFILGVDYFVLKRDEAHKCFGIVAPNGLVLLTESGYLILVKAFTDDLAWKVQRELVNCYFKQNVHPETPPLFAPQTLAPIVSPLPSSALTVPNVQGLTRKTVMDIPQNKEAQRYIKEICDTATALQVVVENYNRYLEPGSSERYAIVLKELGFKASCACSDLGRVKLRKIEAL